MMHDYLTSWHADNCVILEVRPKDTQSLNILDLVLFQQI